MKWLSVAAVVLALVASVHAQAPRRPIKHEDVWLMRRISEPVMSPDGKWAVVNVTEPAYDAKDEQHDLWLIAMAGDVEPRRITATRAVESGIDWSPDGQKIAFSSRRDDDEAPQIYVLDLAAGGDAERITHLSTGARDPRWSPDGRRLLFVSDVYPAAPDDAANAELLKEHRERKANVRVYERFPVRNWDRWLDEKRAHLFVQDASAGASPRDLFSGVSLVNEAGFAGRLSARGEELDPVWTPDGHGIVFVASVNGDEASYSEVNTQLFMVSLEGGEPQRLTSDADSYGRPLFAPDGRKLVVPVALGKTGFEYNAERLIRFPWPFDASKRTDLIGKFDLAPRHLVMSSDGQRVYFTAEQAGLEKVFSVSIDVGSVRAELDASSGVVTNLAGGGEGAQFRLIALWSSAQSPAEAYAFVPGAKAVLKPLTHFNRERAAALDLFPLEHLWFQTSRGDRLHSLIVRPAGFDPNKKYPVVAWVHGGPHAMARDAFLTRWNYHLLAGSDYVLVLTNYVGSTGFGEAFARGIQGNPLKGPAEDVGDALDEVARRYAFVDGSRMAILGASYGAHIVNWFEATTTRYRCLVAHAGLVNEEAQWATSDMMFGREAMNGGPPWDENSSVWREQNPIRLVANHDNKTGWLTPMLLSVGEKDFRVPINNTLENWSYLQRLRVPSRLLVFPDENQYIANGEDSRYWYGELRAWLKRWMDPEKEKR